MYITLKDKVAVVTGAGAGIGEAIARHFADAGARVVVSDIDRTAAERVAGSLPDAVAVRADVTQESEVEALVAAAVDAFGRIDVVVPNAGIATTVPVAATTFADWRKVLDVNLDGVFLTIRHALPVMVEGGGGTIVNISSITSLRGSALVGSYAAAKAAVNNLSKTVAAEMRGHGIRANAVQPGFIDTALVTSHQGAFEEALGLEPGGFDDLMVTKQTRYGKAEEVAAAVTFLASDASSWCNGSTLVLDGGFTSALL